MADDIDNLWSKLTLCDEENSVVAVHQNTVVEANTHCLIGRSLSRKPINIDILRSVLYKIWRLNHAFQVSELGEKLYLFRFERVGEMNRILLQQPWNFNKALIVLNEFDGSSPPDAINLDWCSFWVHIYGLPFACMTAETGLSIGKQIGIVEEVNLCGDKATWGKFLRVRISMNITKPLKRGTKVQLPLQGISVVMFKYEKLPDFCFVCGCLTHIETECEIAYTMKKNTRKYIRQYGNWLRAEVPGSLTNTFEAPTISMSTHSCNLFGEQYGHHHPKIGMGGQSPIDKVADNSLMFDSTPNKGILTVPAENAIPDPQLTPTPIADLQDHEMNTNLAVISKNLADQKLISGDDDNLTQKAKQPVQLGESSTSGVDKSTFVFSSANSNPIPLSKRPSHWKRTARSNASKSAMAAVSSKGGKRISGRVDTDEGASSLTSKKLRDHGIIEKNLSDVPISARSHLSWVCGGDFNEITNLDENLGGAARPQWQMDNFNQAIGDCELHSIPVKGPRLTWSKYMDGERIFERLDRFLVTEDWLQMFNFSFEEHLVTSVSDHLPISLHILNHPDHQIRSKKQFRFENMWLEHEDIQNVVSQKGQEGGDCSLLKQCERDLNLLYKQEETLWWQRSRSLWLRDGDKNTKYFHSTATLRKRRSCINSITDDAGQVFSDEDNITRVILDYYQSIFTSDNPDLSNIQEVSNLIGTRLTNEMRDLLDQDFTEEDIKVATFQMNPSKAPGPDGMNPCFYQKFWHVIGKDVSTMALQFLNAGLPLSDINHTTIVLIPKLANPNNVKEYRPISLCNVIIKIITKAITNRLKLILPQIISETQSAFVPDRQIFDNLIIAFETIHHMANRRAGNNFHMALKLDLSKAYDRVEWQFLEEVMRGMGFSERWIFRVMTCVRTVTYSVSVNGNHSGRIIPTRGIHQGDPLSPYLFLLCMEGFTSLLQRAENNGLIQGVAVARHAPRISHLFFADDSLLFIRAQSSDCTTIIDVLHKFELASGQQINIEKSSVFFSSNTPENTRSSIMELLGVRKILDRDKYLGLPIMLGRSKKRELQYIKNRLLAKIRGWNCRFLSIAGKSILIQSTAQSIPQYLMSVFKFPQTFLHELNMAVANYWWGKGSERRSIHWKNWSSLCISKLDGGLGFRDFEAFNLALLAKQCWRLMHNQQSLCFRLLKAKYINNSNFLQANLRTNPSFVWRSLLAGRKILVEGSRWRIGSGFSVPVRNAKWINKPPTYCPQLLEGVQPNHMIMAELIHQTDRRWLVDKLQELFIEEDVYQIASIPLPLEFESDSLTWNH
ncbi:reverse transcriptase [Corchorus capsularis]|uniref:Reverse transcriptase n=1 Tax=Corchorus capsularis TaxID=210143 RepID=A0A1R3HC88_COCAP|nr:reverse transcriptase [Corchorus capsularis]